MFWWRRHREEPEFIVFGLGNPGIDHAVTRHNVGWWVLDELARVAAVQRTAARHRAQVDYCKLEGIATALVKPTTFMNRSGQCVAAWLREHPQSRFVVVFDDITMAPGKARLRRQGSAGGHRGLASVIAALRSEEFDRLKLGVGGPPAGQDPADYVLVPPTPQEEELIAGAVQRAVRALGALAQGQYQQAIDLLARTDGT